MKRHDVMYRIIKKQSDKIAVLFFIYPQNTKKYEK